MGSILFRKPGVIGTAATDRYESLGFSENPFPQEPSLVPNSPDPRLNGTIYCMELHAPNRSQFEDLLIPTSSGKPVKSVAFLMDHATRRGRGIGKSAFLKHQQDSIMKDLGEEASRGTSVLFAVYVVPTANPPCRKFWEFSRCLFEAMCDQGIIAKAVWRLRGLSGKIPEEVMNKIEASNAWEETIGNNDWLEREGVSVLFHLNHAVKEALLSAGIPEAQASVLSEWGSSPDELRRRWLPGLTDSFWRKEGASLVFDSLVRMFKAAMFTRGLLLVDELEKVVYHQNVLERRAFVDSLRYYLLDGTCENARQRFFGLLLTIHPGIQEILLSHWNAAGLDRLAPLNQPDAQQCTLYFGPLDGPMSLPLVTAYLDHFRINASEKSKIEPFTKDAVIEALVCSGGVPGRTLNLLHRVVEDAANRKLSRIDKDVVITVASASEKTEAKEVEEKTLLPEAKVELTD